MPKITFTISQENLDTLNAHLEEGREVSPEKTFTLGGGDYGLYPSRFGRGLEGRLLAGSLGL